MDPQDAIDFSREAIWTCIMVGGPILAISLTVGLLVSVIQALTQLHDQSISFAPKILLLLVAIAAALPWLSEKMIDFTKYSLERPVIFQPMMSTVEAPGDLQLVDNGESASVALPSPKLEFLWAKESSLPTLHSQFPTTQPQLKPATTLQPRPSAPFSLPTYRQARTPESARDTPHEF